MEMNRVTTTLDEERIRDVNKVSRVLRLQMKGTDFFPTTELLDQFMLSFTNYSISSFLNLSYSGSSEWHIAGFILVPQLSTVPANATSTVFGSIESDASYFKHVKFCLEFGEENNRKTVDVKIWNRMSQNKTDVMGLHATCSCPFYRSAGIPCRHLTRVAFQYADYTKTNPTIKEYLGTKESLNLSSMFHKYWRRKRTSRRDEVIRSRFTTTTDQSVGLSMNVNEGEQVNVAGAPNPIEKDVRYSNCKAVFDQIFRHVECQGAYASSVFKSALDAMLAQSTRGGLPGSGIDLDRPLDLETAPNNQDFIRSEGNNIVINGEIGNPTVRRAGNRGSNKRKRSFLERGGRKSLRIKRGRAAPRKVEHT